MNTLLSLAARALVAFPGLAMATDLGGSAEINIGHEGNPIGIRWAIVGFVQSVLWYMALVCVIMIIIAGMYLIFSLGNDSNKETAKKIVIYTIVGLLLIILSKAIIYFVIGAVY
jgi:hypothetical protein